MKVLKIFGTLLFWGIASAYGFFGANQPDKAVERQRKYLGGTEERIAFYSRLNGSSNQFISRNGLLIRRPKAKATVLICHGFMCDKRDIKFLRLVFSDYNVVLFDFRAHGENTQNQYCSLGCDEAYDVLGAAQFIKQDPELKNLPLFVYGFSMGACASILAQSMEPSLFAGAIWDCPFDSTEKIIERNIGKVKLRIFGYEWSIPNSLLTFFQKYAFHPYIQGMVKAVFKALAKIDASQINTCIARVEPAKAIKNVAIPTFFIACKNDEKAPVDAVRSIYDGAAGYKRLWITDGKYHFYSFFENPEQYTHKVRAFIEKVLSNSITKKEQQKIIDDSLPNNKEPQKEMI